MTTRSNLRLFTIVSVMLVGTPAAAAPSQLDQAKKVYAEGKALLDAKNYVNAMSKFEEAYRLAPDKHVFNYNIAAAAELAGDCRKAEQHYKMFLDLVPEHDARGDAKKTVAQLAKTCAHDDEGASELTIAARDDREAEREQAIGERALGDALRATEQSVARYEAIIAKHGKQQPFAKVLRAKRRDMKKIAKLFDSHGFGAPESFKGDVGAPSTVEQACRQAETQEERNIATYEKAYDVFEDAETAKLMDKLLNRVEGRQLRAFRDTCPR